MRKRKLDHLAALELADLFRRRAGPPPKASLSPLLDLIERIVLTSRELRKNGWDEKELHQAGWIMGHYKDWTSCGPITALIFNRKPNLSGVFVERPHPIKTIEQVGPLGIRRNVTLMGSPGYQLKSRQWEKFITAFRRWLSSEKRARTAAIAPATSPADRVRLNQRYRHLRSRAEKIRRSFSAKYGELALSLWAPVSWDRWTNAIPYFNPLYFPKTKEGRRMFEELAALVHQLYEISKGVSSGGPSETKALTPEEQAAAERPGPMNERFERVFFDHRDGELWNARESKPSLKKAIYRHLRRRKK